MLKEELAATASPLPGMTANAAATAASIQDGSPKFIPRTIPPIVSHHARRLSSSLPLPLRIDDVMDSAVDTAGLSMESMPPGSAAAAGVGATSGNIGYGGPQEVVALVNTLSVCTDSLLQI